VTAQANKILNLMTNIRNLFLLPVLIVGLGLLLTGQAEAQTFTNLHNFTALKSSTNSDGAQPLFAGLISVGSTLYGTANAGGAEGGGTVFAINTSGTGFTNIHTFLYDASFNFTSGVSPEGGLVLSGSTLYGTTEGGGAFTWGDVFAVNTDGTGFTNLYGFTGGSDGASPRGNLILTGGRLYGTTSGRGGTSVGTVFSVNAGGGGFSNLFIFPPLDDFSDNTNGAYPNYNLVLAGNTLYGTTQAGGTNGNGTIFALNTDGTGLTNLYTFTALNNYFTNSDGAEPYCGLALSGITLYGTTIKGGTVGCGTVFAINTDGTGFTNLHSLTQNDGNSQGAGLIVSGSTLYGASVNEGPGGEGAVFAVNTDGTGFTNLYNFTALTGGTNSDGAGPQAGLLLSGNILYGAARFGGTADNGTLFALSLPVPPTIGITTAGNQIVLSWPTNATGVNLQTVTSLATGTWSNVTAGITIDGANYTFTNTANGSAAFFRLLQP
jgi:uncharacterized repeat protein (TIGR03803 family)